AYRLSGEAEFEDMGLDFHGDHVVHLIEWGERVQKLFPDALRLEIVFGDGEEREMALSSTSSRWSRLPEQLAALRDA
ncbi:MAG: tRNA A37 threonylcarbamoyladenosine biosynthesis protein TsaE, partial [Bradymonadia bacterium]